MKNLSKTLLILLLLAMMFTFVACDKTGDKVDYVFDVNIKSVEVVDGQCIVHLTREEGGRKVGVSKMSVTQTTSDFYEVYDYTITLEGSAIFSAVSRRLAQDDTLLNGQEYSTLKIIYDYDTIYKSMKSKCDKLTKQDGKYIHSFEVKRGVFDLTLARKTPRQSAWYGTAIGMAVLLLATTLILMYLRGKYGRENQEN